MTDTPAVLSDYPLELVQSQTFYRRFAWRLTGTGPTDESATYGNFHDFNVRSQVRTKEDPTADLIIDLTAYFTVVNDSGTDGKFLDLTVPGHATAVLDSYSALRKATAAWDIFLVAGTDHTVDTLFLEGPASMDYAATDMRTAEA